MRINLDRATLHSTIELALAQKDIRARVCPLEYIALEKMLDNTAHFPFYNSMLREATVSLDMDEYNLLKRAWQ